MLTGSDLDVLREFIAAKAEDSPQDAWWVARCAALLTEYECLEQQLEVSARKAALSWPMTDRALNRELAPRGQVRMWA